MRLRPASRGFNLAFWLVVAGFVGCGLMIWLPVGAAQRRARVEGRADLLAETLCSVASALQPLAALPDPEPATLREPGEPAEPGGEPAVTEATLATVFARFLAATAARDEFVGDVERLPAQPGVLLCLRNKHYLFQLAFTDLPDEPETHADAVRAVEVIAWPAEVVGPSRTVFFHPENAEGAYTRNLEAGYAGLGERRPQPGRSHRRPGGLFDVAFAYRSYDDERWLVRDTPPGLTRAKLRRRSNS